MKCANKSCTKCNDKLTAELEAERLDEKLDEQTAITNFIRKRRKSDRKK